MMDDYQNRWFADGAVRKSNKTKGEFRGEARIAVRKRLKTKDGDFASGGLFGRRWSLRKARIGREVTATGAFSVAERQKGEAERAGDRKSCGSI